ncbi:MAG: hypothetical protein LBL58_06985 [Tannerellaceae bacterium]|jgi:hypothetical protein|nr:hypothetical protein [Tannerellaceae bacterium]
MKKKKRNQLDDYMKANRKGSREAELENHSHPINHHRIHVSKKTYSRKKYKADPNDLPYLFLVVPSLFTHHTY